MRTDIMKLQIKAFEKQREIDLTRVANRKHNSANNKNAGGNSGSEPLLHDYCPMCEVCFYGNPNWHINSELHRVGIYT